MRLAKWLVLVLMALIATLVFVRERKGGAAPPSGPSSSGERAETSQEVTAPLALDRPPAVPVETVPPPASTGGVSQLDELAGGHHLQVIVQNEAGQGLEGAVVRTSFRGEHRRPALTNLSRTFTTSSHGMADVLWPTQKFEQLELLVFRDDYAPRRMLWDLQTGDEIPPTYTVKLKGAVHIGGLVVDPDGGPVAEATVSLSRFWRGGEETQTKGEEPAFPTQKHTTGADGRWVARNLPSELLERIFISGSHSNFIGVTVSMDGKPEIEKQLRDGAYQLALKRGLEVRGRVINEEQQPIAEARVWAGRRFSRERQETRSDAEGRFTFRNVNEGKIDFSATAEGYAPAAKSHPVGADTEELVFQLTPGSVIRGSVQDESGQAIAGVRVVLEGSPGEDSYDRFEFSTTTDSDGQFEWNSAPNKPMPFYFGKTGYEQKRGVRLKPAEDYVVTLRLGRKLEGQVVDSETSQPVTNFTISVGRYFGENQFYRDSGGTKEFKSEQGLFTMDLNEESQNGVQVTAREYAELTQALPKADGRQVKVLLRMRSSKALEGIVVTSDGRPVSGAAVALVDGNPGGRSVQFAQGKMRSSSTRAKVIVTDASGHFEIPSPPEIGTIVAVNGTGFGSASVAELRTSGLLMLQAFGRIEGVLLRGSAPAAGQELLLTSPGVGINFDFETARQITDAEGRFAFENVPAGTLSIVRLVKSSARSWMHSHRTDVVVAAGETAQVTLGGVDATVQGMVRFETAPAETDYLMNARLSTVAPQIPAGLSPEQRTELLSSPEWKEQMKSRKHYSAAVGSDGALIFDSIAPGQYTLNVTATKPGEDSFSAKPVAEGAMTITVPSGADPGTPLQIGEVLLKLPR